MQDLKKYLGVLIGALYALVIRLVFGIDEFGKAFSLLTVTFVWVTPVIIGIIPFLFASKEELGDWTYRMGSPVLTTLVFFLVCFTSRLEDLICLWIILLPYLLGALIAGLVAAEIILALKKRKERMYTIVLLPFLLCPIEQQLSKPAAVYSVTSKVIINASPDHIWKNIVRVRAIDEKEYHKGFFNYAGIPRPLYAELNKDTIGGTRTGYFEGGLKFVEQVREWDRNKRISFSIRVIPSSIRQTVFDQHILKGGHFRFVNAAYELKQVVGGQTELSLRSSYELKTGINTYAAYCGDQLLADFQERLLEVIKVRCE